MAGLLLKLAGSLLETAQTIVRNQVNYNGLLTGARKTGKFELARKTAGVTIEEQSKSIKELGEWLVK